MAHNVIVVLMVALFVSELAVFLYQGTAFKHLKKMTFPNMVGLSTIATSILFTAVAGTLVLFTGNGVHEVCQAASWVCVFLYMATKGQLYIFFIERMHIVHKKPSQTRMESPLYIFNMCLLIPFFGILALMIAYRVAYVGDDQHCRHGVRREGTIPGLIYDTLFSVYSVAVFVWPLFKSRSDTLQWAIKKNIVGSVVSTVSSFLNAFSLFYQEVQDTDSCLLRCTVDVMVNVMVLNYLVSSSSSSGGKRQVRLDELKNSETYYRSKSSALSHCSSEIDEVSNNPSKVYPIISGRNTFEPRYNSENLATTDNDCVMTLAQEDSVVEEFL